MLRTRAKQFCVFALMAFLLVALVALAATGCGSSASTTTTVSPTAQTAANTTGSSVAGSTTTVAPVTSESQPSGTQSLASLLGKYKQAESVSLDFTVTSPAGATVTGKIWEQSGKMLKIETTVNSVTSVIIIDLTANTMTEYQPATNRGVKTKVTIPFQDPAGYAKDLKVSNVKDLGNEVINGQTCRVIQYTPTSAVAGTPTTTVKMWLSERLGFPLKLTSTTADGKTTTIEYTNIKVGALPSDTFTVPASVTITSTP